MAAGRSWSVAGGGGGGARYLNTWGGSGGAGRALLENAEKGGAEDVKKMNTKRKNHLQTRGAVFTFSLRIQIKLFRVLWSSIEV